MRRIPIIAAAVFATVLVGAGIAGAAEDGLDKVRAELTARFPQIEPESIKEGPIPGFYEIRQGVLVAYVTGEGRYLLQGEIIDLETDTNITAAAMNTERLKLVEGLSDDEAIVFSPEKPTHTVYVFTDIDCGFCRKLHREIDQYNEKGISVHYLLYPRGGPGAASWTKAEKVWCADDRNDALTRAKNDQPFETQECDASIVSRHFAMGRDVGLRGTPAIVTETGELVSGYMPPAQLLQRLESETATP